MRRTSSALTTTILGAIIMASTVSAQQFLPSASSRRGSAAASASASESAPAPDSATVPAPPAGSKADPIFGMAASRGARYLLRNGMDYLSYQEYERALKYFREAEIRQRELNEAERLSLKQGIERAQRGLREAVGSETPYALSKRSRRAGGFAAAKPDSQVATASSSATQRRSAGAMPRITNREGDEQGEPVRLARAEIASTSATAPAAASPEPIPGEMPKPLPLASDQPAQLPEIPKLPQIAETADLPPAVAQTGAGTTAEAAHPVPAAGNDGQQNQAMTPAPAGLAFPEQAKLHEALRQPPPSVAAAPVSTPSEAPAPAPVPETTKLDAGTPVPGVAGLDAAAAAQADLASPLPTLVPTEQPSVSGTKKQDQGAASDPAASAEVPLLTQTQSQPKSEPNVGDKPGDPSPSLSLDPAVAPSASASPSPSAEALAAAQDPATAQSLAETPRATQPTSDLAAPKAKASPSADKAVEAAALPAVTAVSEPSLTPPAPINLETPADAGTKPAPVPAPAPAAPTNPAPTPTPTQMPEQRSADPDSIPLPPLGNEGEQPKRGNEDQQPSSTKTSEPAQSAASATAPATASATAPAAADSASTAVPAVAAATEELPSLPRSDNHQSDKATQAEPLPASADDLPPLPAAGPAPASAGTGAEASQPPKATSPGSVPEAVPSPPASSDATIPAATSNPAPVSLEPKPTGTPELKPAGESPTGPARAAEASGANVSAPAGSPVAEAREPLPAAASPVPAQEEPSPGAIPAGPLIGEPATPARPNFVVRQEPASDSFIPQRANAPSTLRPELKRQVEEMVRRQDDELSRRQAQPAAPPTQREGFSDLRNQTQTNVDISRAPSPAEARPIRAIPVPEDWVPLARREWTPQSKYWAAAATCHMPLYFQDPMLERYGHSVETFLGPTGRYLAYPVDDHTQSTQRNQMAQPFFSVGLFAFQIVAWPYNLIMDPPWEAQYDLGYWRPGDKIPTDLYYMPLHGIGPPLRGMKY